MVVVIIALTVLGLCLGSFVNALVWRVHKQGQRTKNVERRTKNGAEDYSILNGRSMCTRCKHILAWYDLIPVVSWISLGGKCRYCHKHISIQYPLVEISTAVLFAVSYAFWPSEFHLPSSIFLFGLWLIILTGLVALAVYDLRWMLLPDRIVFPLQGIAFVYVLASFLESSGDLHILLGAFLGILCSAGLFYVLFHVSNGKWIGGGDVKLAVVLGLVLGGAVEALLMLFIASAVGSLIGIPLLVAKKTKLQGKLPFGPLLIGSTIIVVLFGASIIGWYKHQFLFI